MTATPPPVPLQGIYPLGGSLAQALDTRGKLWRGDLRFARGETVELSQETPEAMRQVIGVRAGAYALVLETVDFATGGTTPVKGMRSSEESRNK